MSSSASDTTASTLSLAEISVIEGYGNDDNIHQFVGIEDLRKAIDLQTKRLEEGVSDQQYLVFRHVTEADLEKIYDVRDSIGKHTRLTHYGDASVLIVKIHTRLTALAASTFAAAFTKQVMEMGTPDDELCSQKKIEPTSQRSSWGLEHESLQCLRSNARWWLENSEGEVKIIVIVLIEAGDRRLQIEIWELYSGVYSSKMQPFAFILRCLLSLLYCF